ncbi:MAG: MFS transporter [Sphingomonadales bacterium]|nr:MFS transporter [Sphingomonadales bacterium]
MAVVSGEHSSGTAERATVYGWVVFALTFGLLISDYMARQVLNAVFPLLKQEWSLSDGELGALSGVVALMVGLLTIPLSLLADRWGRIRSITVMAVLWSMATLLCGIARTYPEMFVGRILVGVGEAAYGSVGIAVVLSVFPARMRATLSAAFIAGGLTGQVLGVAIGGWVAQVHGWRTAFTAIALAGLALAVAYPLLVKQRRMEAVGAMPGSPRAERPPFRSVFAKRSLVLVYVANGLQYYVAGALPAWLPTYFGRYYGLPVAKAASTAALFLLLAGAGMVLCGIATDRIARHNPGATPLLALGFCLGCAAALGLAFLLPPGPVQLALLAIGAFLCAASTGPSGAMVAGLTPLAIHGTAFATVTLANNIFGLAPGPFLTGKIADSIGLLGAFQLLVIPALLAALTFAAMRRGYLMDRAAA